MMGIPKEELHRLAGGTDRKLAERVVMVAHEFGYDLETMKRMPIPAFIFILKRMDEEAREIKRRQRCKG